MVVSVPRLMIICIIHVLEIRNTGLKQDVHQKEKKFIFFFSICGIFNLLAFVSQGLLALKEAKHYHFSFHIGIFNAASSFKGEQSYHKSKLLILKAKIFYIFTSKFKI